MRIDPFDPPPDVGAMVYDRGFPTATSLAAERPAAAVPAVRPAVAIAAAAEPETYIGPFDREAWPEQIVAHVVSPGADPRIHGYAVAGDLARHCGLAEVAWLTLRGELPSPAQRAAFEAALVLMAPVHIGEAPGHAAFLSRIAGAPPSATIAIGAVGLGEQARTERAELAPWLAWLEAAAVAGADPGPVPASARAIDPSADAIAAQAWLDGSMRAWFGPAQGLPAAPLHRVACAHAILHRLGVRDALLVEALAAWARLPAVIAEAAFARAGAVRLYPARLPDYQYVDDQGAQP